MSNRSHYGNSILTFLRKRDSASGSVMGVLLIAVVALGLMVVAAIGNIMVCKARAQTAADISALTAATTHNEGSSTACIQADRVASANKGQLSSCKIIEQDVQVQVQVPTQVPFVDTVTAKSRAGPHYCSE